MTDEPRDDAEAYSESRRPDRPPRPEREARRGRDDDDDEDWDRPARRRRPEPAMGETDLLVPTNVSPWAIASCYLGLIGFCLPVVGLVFAIPALICGIVAIRRRSKSQTYGGVTSNIRAVIGVVLSSLALVGNTVLLIIWATSK